MDNKCWSNMNIKREIIDLFGNSRILFNDYYNGFATEYYDSDLEKIKKIISDIEINIKNIREEITYYE